jgi:aldose 1-epimerase
VPFGLGFHPYLTLGTTTIDEVRLLIPARKRLVADDRGLPTADAEVGGTKFDFSGSRLIGGAMLDTGFTELIRGKDDIARAELEHPDGKKGVTVWMDNGFRYLMVYTADKVTDAKRARKSIAIEPMTCPPNALRTGTDVINLPPEGSWRGAWGISPR